jgi:hypothetical protein
VAKRPSTPKEVPDAVRDAVERTVQATVGSADRGRARAQGAVDELVDTVDDLRREAEARITKSGRSVLPANQEDVRAIRAELRKIARRLDAIEERLPAKRRSGGGKGSRSKRSS